jgi:hypothetical protein
MVLDKTFVRQILKIFSDGLKFFPEIKNREEEKTAFPLNILAVKNFLCVSLLFRKKTEPLIDTIKKPRLHGAFVPHPAFMLGLAGIFFEVFMNSASRRLFPVRHRIRNFQGEQNFAHMLLLSALLIKKLQQFFLFCQIEAKKENYHNHDTCEYPSNHFLPSVMVASN